MALDKVVHDNLDLMDDIEARMNKWLEDRFKSISIDALIDAPEKGMLGIAAEFKQFIEDDLAIDSMQAGVSLARDVDEEIKAGTKIEVSDSEDENLNEGLVDVRSEDKTRQD